MIYTVTLNPSLDYVIGLRNITIGHLNRTDEEIIRAGGKGINVSMVLQELDVPNVAMGFLAGFTGMEVKRQLVAKGIPTRFIEVDKGMTRINVKLQDKTETEINGRGPDITIDNLESLMELMKDFESDDILVLSGSVPKTLPKNTYEEIMHHVADKNMKIVVDTSGESLRKVLPMRPFLVKPNLQELGDLFRMRLESKREILMCAKQVQEMGARNVLVSRGHQGALLLTEDGDIMESTAHRGIVKNTVGAGDSMVAGFLAGFLDKGDYRYALQFGAAAGSATAFSPGLGSGDKINDLLSRSVVL